MTPEIITKISLTIAGIVAFMIALDFITWRIAHGFRLKMLEREIEGRVCRLETALAQEGADKARIDWIEAAEPFMYRQYDDTWIVVASPDNMAVRPTLREAIDQAIEKAAGEEEEAEAEEEKEAARETDEP